MDCDFNCAVKSIRLTHDGDTHFVLRKNPRLCRRDRGVQCLFGPMRQDRFASAVVGHRSTVFLQRQESLHDLFLRFRNGLVVDIS
jgi:hypothetical protein